MDEDGGPDMPPARAERDISWRKRAAVWDACGGHCTYCGVELHPFYTFTVDHVIPRSAGGTNALGNLAGACPGCNQAKGDAIPLPASRNRRRGRRQSGVDRPRAMRLANQQAADLRRTPFKAD